MKEQMKVVKINREGESFWLADIRVEEEGLLSGRVDNKLICKHEFKFADRIKFKEEEVIDEALIEPVMKKLRIVIDLEYNEEEIDFDTIIEHTIGVEIVKKLKEGFIHSKEESISDGCLIEGYEFEVYDYENRYPPEQK